MAEGRTLTVLTQNAFGGGPRWDIRRHLLARRIRELGPDVVGLQEIHAAEPSGASGQAHELAALIGGYHADFAPARIAPSGACEGVALLCRTEVRERAVATLTLDPKDLFERPGRRVVLSAAIDLAPSCTVDVLVTHLSLSKRARERTMREVIDFAATGRARSGAVASLLMGDLNALPDEEAIALLERCPDSHGGPWVDAWKRAGAGGRGATWPSIAPWRRLDYVFVQPAARWTVEACVIEPVTGSDHRGLLARVRVEA